MTRTFSHAIRFLFSAIVTIALAACAANSDNGVAGAAAGAQTGASQASVAPDSIQNDAGEFGGKIKDSVFGKGFASGSLAQVKNEVGGYVIATYGTDSITNAFTAETQTGLSLSGAEVATINSEACSFKMSATYDPKSHILAGKYSSVHGCPGESGSFSLTKGCFYPRVGLLDSIAPWSRNAGARPDSGLHPC